MTPSVAQTLDTFNPGANGATAAFAVQPDGKIIVGGSFTSIAGTPRNRIARLNSDGTLDVSFNPNAGNSVGALAIQTDGKIILGGSFTNLGGQAHSYIGRLNSDGSVDAGFIASADNQVSCLALQADGKILMGGTFRSLNGQAHGCLGRLKADGSLDTSFTASASTLPPAIPSVQTFAVQPDGKILVGGSFNSMTGISRNYLARLNSNGTVDTTFTIGANQLVDCIAIAADSSLIIGGGFTTLGGKVCTNLGVLSATGAVNTNFNAMVNNEVTGLAVQADGSILIGGRFTRVAGAALTNLARLFPDGTLDTSFNAQLRGSAFPPGLGLLNSFTLQPDGNILVGGTFTSVLGQVRTYIARLINTSTASDSLTFDASSVTWMRGNSAPEAWRASFETSTNGTDWLVLGAGTRISGGWSLSNIVVPDNPTLRARAFLAQGTHQALVGFAESTLGPPAIDIQPRSQTNAYGTITYFSAQAAGSAPFNYQWRKDGANLADGGVLYGSQTPRLELIAFGTNAGAYDVVINNSFGSVTSLVATLSVLDPVISIQPVSIETNLGQSVTFAVTATGTQPLAYQWRLNGLWLAAATNSILTLPSVQGSDAGAYDVIVTNDFGAATSAVAVLTVNLATVDSWNSGVADQVLCLALQPDGKLLGGGGLGTNFIERLNADGSFDNTFNVGADSQVSAIILQPDGDILLGGGFITVGGQRRIRLARVHPDGSLDQGFNPGTNGSVYSVVQQADGKFVVGGTFTALGGQPCNYLGRLNLDGTLDTNFTAVVNNTVACLALQPDDKILVSGTFGTVNGQLRNQIARLNPDGSLDAAFNPGQNGMVAAMVVQADGKILVGGNFTTLAGQSRNNLGRLNGDGTLDPAFNPGADGWVVTLALQLDGRILVGGYFQHLGGQLRSYIGRLNADGQIDPTFDPGAQYAVEVLTLQPDGKILVGGVFYTLGGVGRTNLGRLLNPGGTTNSLSFDGSSITWLCSGTGPETWRTTFESSTDGTNWSSMGTVLRIAGGWLLATNTSAATTSTVRARGFVGSVNSYGSSWYVEQLLVPPLPPAIVLQDANFGVRSNLFGFDVRALPGQTVVVETTTDFVNWVAVQTNYLSGASTFLFTDTASSGFTRRFYRARLQ